MIRFQPHIPIERARVLWRLDHDHGGSAIAELVVIDTMGKPVPLAVFDRYPCDDGNSCAGWGIDYGPAELLTRLTTCYGWVSHETLGRAVVELGKIIRPHHPATNFGAQP